MYLGKIRYLGNGARPERRGVYEPNPLRFGVHLFLSASQPAGSGESCYKRAPHYEL